MLVEKKKAARSLPGKPQITSTFQTLAFSLVTSHGMNLKRRFGTIVRVVIKTVFATTHQHVYHHRMQVTSFTYSQELMMRRLVKSIATIMEDAGIILGMLNCIERRSSVPSFPLAITFTRNASNGS